MIAHVASVGEDRGRVVLRLSPSAEPNRIALEAAIRVAQAFRSEIESLFVAESHLFDLANFPFAREISLSGRQTRSLSIADVERDIQMVAAALQRQVEDLARRAEVPVRRRIVRAASLDAIAHACAECGPWNVVALAEPFQPAAAPALRELFQTVAGATGVILVGPNARRTSGPVVAIVEEVDRIPGMLRAAERLAAITGGEIQLLLVAESAEQAETLDAQARLVVGPAAEIRIVAMQARPGAEAEAAENLRRLQAGFVLAQFGGLVVPADGDFKPLAAALECPIFLVR